MGNHSLSSPHRVRQLLRFQRLQVSAVHHTARLPSLITAVLQEIVYHFESVEIIQQRLLFLQEMAIRSVHNLVYKNGSNSFLSRIITEQICASRDPDQLSSSNSRARQASVHSAVTCCAILLPWQVAFPATTVLSYLVDYCICKYVRTNFEVASSPSLDCTSVNTLTSKDPTGTGSHPGLPSVLPTVLLSVRQQFIIQFSVQWRLQNSTGKVAWFFETIKYMWAKKKTLDLRYWDANQGLSSNEGIRLKRGSSKQLPQPRFIFFIIFPLRLADSDVSIICSRRCPTVCILTSVVSTNGSSLSQGLQLLYKLSSARVLSPIAYVVAVTWSRQLNTFPQEISRHN